eukprot:6786155-Prymnesium_polylepis.1
MAANGSARAVCPALCSDGKPMRRMTASSAYAVAKPGKPSSGSVAICRIFAAFTQLLPCVRR